MAAAPPPLPPLNRTGAVLPTPTPCAACTLATPSAGKHGALICRLPGAHEGPGSCRPGPQHQEVSLACGRCSAAMALPAFTCGLSTLPSPRCFCSFIRQFEERSSGQAVDPEADSTRVQAFLAQSERMFRAHPVWRGCQPEVLDQAVEVSGTRWPHCCISSCRAPLLPAGCARCSGQATHCLAARLHVP